MYILEHNPLNPDTKAMIIVSLSSEISYSITLT